RSRSARLAGHAARASLRHDGNGRRGPRCVERTQSRHHAQPRFRRTRPHDERLERGGGTGAGKIMSGVDANIFDLGNVWLALDERRSAERFAARTGKSVEEVESYFRTTAHATELALGKLTRRQFFRIVSHDTGFAGSYEEFAEIWSDIFDPIEP